uniref:myosin light chain kinase 3-like n=1 Tax=Pristiophorus japonicus TaxID=55135 RepID=UPI00398F4533
MSQPVTLVNSLAKAFDPNTPRSQGAPAWKPVTGAPDSLQAMHLKLDGLTEKVETLTSAQGRLLRRLEGSREAGGEGDPGPGRSWRAEVTQGLAHLRREAEGQSRRMEAMEKVLRAVEKVTGFLGDTFGRSRIAEFLRTGRVGPKVKGQRDGGAKVSGQPQQRQRVTRHLYCNRTMSRGTSHNVV